MNYIELINNFWQKDLEYNFSDKEIALYFYLLKVSNSIGWKNPFGLSNSMTIAKFGWGKKSFDAAKNTLKLAGLISFRSGDGRGNVYQYSIIGEKVTKKGTQKTPLSAHLYAPLSGTLSEQKGATSINININETNTPVSPQGELFKNPEVESKDPKKKKGQKKELSFEFVEVAYKSVFMRFMEYRKEIKKPFKSQKGIEGCYADLKKFSGNNVQKAASIVQQSISNEYQGLFPLKKSVDVPAEKFNDQLSKFAQRLHNLSNE